MNYIKSIKNIRLFFTILLLTVSNLVWPSENQKNINSSLDSIKKKILHNGLSQQTLTAYQYNILNCKINTGEELKFVLSMPQDDNQKLLLGTIYKRKADFKNEYESILPLLKNIPTNCDYYEQLILSAKTQNKINEVETIIYNLSENNDYYQYGKALLSYNKGNYKTASEILNNLINENFKNSSVYYLYAYSLRGLGNYETAVAALKIAKKYVKEQKNLPKILNAEGSLYYLSGDYNNAKKYYTSAQKLSRKHRNNFELTKSFVNLAIIFDDEGDITNARTFFNNALQTARKINSIELQALVHSELGVSYTFDNRLVDAEEHYNKSLELYEKLRDNNRLAILYSNLGKIYSNISNYKLALDAFEKGLKFAEQNKRSQILNLTGIADVYANLSNYSKALEYYNSAKKLSSEIKEISTQAEIEEGLGVLEFNLGLPQKALQYFRKAKKISEKLDNTFFNAELLHKFGVTYFAMDSLDLAEKTLLDANKLNVQNSDLYNQLLVELDLSAIYLHADKISVASKLLNKIGKICEEYELSHLIVQQKILLSQLFKKKDSNNEAEKYLIETIAMCNEIKDYNNLIEANYQLGSLYLESGQIELAKKYLIAAKNLLEDISRPLFTKPEIQISYFSSFNKIYETLAKLYLSKGKDKLAFEVIDAQRSRNTAQSLNNLRIIAKIKNNEELKKLYNYDWMINSGIYSDTENEDIKEIFSDLKQKLLDEDPSIKKYLGFTKNLTVDEIQNGLDSTDYFISLFTNDAYTQLFLITNKSFLTKKITVSNDSVASLIRNISPFYENRGTQKEIYFNQDLFSFNAEASNNLYKLILEPLIKDIKHDKNLIFSLPSDMLKIPMEFLVTDYNESDSPYNYKNVRYLVEKYNVSYIPSGNTLLSIKEKGVSNYSNSLLIGDPKISNSSFAYSIRGSLLEDNETLRDLNIVSLDYSKEEIEEINSLLENSKVFLSEKATESNFKKFASESSIIHLSTHSFLYKNQPLIVFSTDGQVSNDGLLERGEIAHLNLTADMVVLSSCKSGLGEIDKSEGVLGMQKSFLDAGANSVIVSLWDVNDKYTSILMKDFYKYLYEGYDKAAALRKAKIKFIKNHSSNPYYWSAFVLTGNSQKINLGRKDFEYNIYLIVLALLVFILLFYYIKKRKSYPFNLLFRNNIKKFK